MIYEQKHTMIKVYFPFARSITQSGIDRDKITVELGKILFEIRGTGFVRNDGGHEDNSPHLMTYVEKLIKP